MGDIIDPKSSNMNISTFDAVQAVKYTIRARGMSATVMFKIEDEKFGPVDRRLCQNIRPAEGRNKEQRADQRAREKEKPVGVWLQKSILKGTRQDNLTRRNRSSAEVCS